MTLAPDRTLLDRVRTLEPVLRQHAEAADRNRRLAPPVVEALRRAGLFRMFAPRAFGGLELDPVTCATVIEAVAAIDSAAGWSLMVGNSIDWWCSRLPPEGPHEMYANGPDVIIAGAFHPPMQARAVDGGYVISGRSPLASNSHDASWFFLTATVTPADGAKADPRTVLAFCRAGECEILDTWHTSGMRGTDSNDIALHDVFVPARRTWTIGAPVEMDTAYSGALYQLPAMAEVAVVIPPVALGIARAALDEFRALATRKTPFGSSTPLAGRVSAQARLARAEAALRSARCFFYDTLESAWARAVDGVAASPEQKADALLAAAHAVASAARAVELVFQAAGTSAIYTRSPLERFFRDIQVVRQHGFVNESRYETVGQVLLGVPPEYGLVLL